MLRSLEHPGGLGPAPCVLLSTKLPQARSLTHSLSGAVTAWEYVRKKLASFTAGTVW